VVEAQELSRLLCDIHYRPSHFDDREVGDGATLERQAVLGAEFAIATDPRARVRTDFWMQGERVSNGWNLRGEGVLGMRLLPELDLEILPTYIYTEGEPRWFATEGASYLFGRLRAASMGMTLRATYTFTPRLTFQAYGQAFLAAKHYREFTSFPTDPGGPPPIIHVADLRPVTTPVATNPRIKRAPST